MSDTSKSQHQSAHNYTPLPPHLELTEQFKSCDVADHSLRWDELWKSNECLPWDQGCANPALTNLVVSALADSRHEVQGGEKPLLPPPTNPHTHVRRKALVPGCGRGYDVLLLASAGYDVIGLDISSHAVEAANAWVEAHRESNDKSRDAGRRCGSIKFVCGDFFRDDWLNETNNGFDVIYDYTFLCALPPQLRPDWALRMSQLLAYDPRAVLICVEYPLFKPPCTGGPPFGLSADIYEQHLGRPGKILEYDQDGHVVAETDHSGRAVVEANGLCRRAHEMATRTHAVGQGKDYISVWQRTQEKDLW